MAHELGHYLINEEEIEEIHDESMSDSKLSSNEKWCNEFAYYFLVGARDEELEHIRNADETNDYHWNLIEKISKETHLSTIALFTRLLFRQKISPMNYAKIKDDLDEKYRLKQEESQRQKELNKSQGIQTYGSTPKPIQSPLLISTIRTAFNEGIVNEQYVWQILKITPDKLDSYLK